MNNFVVGVLSSIAGGVAMLIVQYLIRFIKEARGPFTGTWEDRIYDEKGDMIKRDVVHLKQGGEEISGDIQRVYPEDQTHREWRFKGRIRGKDFFAIFWSVDSSVVSYGCWYLHQKTDFLFSGFYLKLDEDPTLTIKQIRIDLERTQAN